VDIAGLDVAESVEKLKRVLTGQVDPDLMPAAAQKQKAKTSRRSGKTKRKSIPHRLQIEIDRIRTAFNLRVLREEELRYVAQFRSGYLYLLYDTPDGVEPFCRLEFTGDMNRWDFSVYRSTSKRFHPPAQSFAGNAFLDGTVEGALKAGVVAYFGGEQAALMVAPTTNRESGVVCEPMNELPAELG